MGEGACALKATELSEESKHDPTDDQNNEELFKHLSYLSQLNDVVSKHQ